MTIAPKTFAFAAGIAMALLLAACAGVPQPPADGSAAAVTASPEPSPDDQRHATQPPASPASPGLSRVAGIPLDQLPGMSGDQVISILGRPQFRRDETAAALWQYRSDGCVLNLFLYPSGDALHVRHAEVRSRPAPKGASDATADFTVATGEAANECLAKLAAAHTRPTS